MKTRAYLVINKNGIKAVRKSKPDLDFDEIACAVDINIPDEFFQRPALQAKIDLSEAEMPKDATVDAIVNSKDVIEKAVGAKVEFKILESDDN